MMIKFYDYQITESLNQADSLRQREAALLFFVENVQKLTYSRPYMNDSNGRLTSIQKLRMAVLAMIVMLVIRDNRIHVSGADELS